MFELSLLGGPLGEASGDPRGPGLLDAEERRERHNCLKRKEALRKALKMNDKYGLDLVLP